MNKQTSSGVTLVEVMIVIAIIGILAAMAVPSFSELMKQQRVEGAAEGLVAALQNAKAEAIKTNNNMGIVFTPATTGTDLNTWCYGMTPAGAATCDCTVANDCASGSVVQSADFTGITVNFNTSNSRAFSPLRGTGTQGTIRFSAGNNKTLGVTTTTIGRIRICKDTTSTIPSYNDSGACP
ncbi:Fimbrial protein pilin [Candidatus Methylobacter favarea]|uniref:Type II secretion system protein H n=1 Tax=Candidatus Methylobacter favarea TaxID=2707345 RepID=A0A8S0WSN6_9GAMM|nr:GspH/FimT family pseudopilin [Candidatus Methylobacter favarea]CAA9892961.1 Fimbrial protein pilin [Candidatus Methylobacter favarea]